jgi:methyl-accepting chemotaxis protein/methyl-accepting chemotaxis protein-1 (serine sensor receptor)
MSIGRKLAISFGAVVGVSLLMSGISLKVIYNLSSGLTRSVNTTVNSVEQVGALTTALAAMRSAEAGFILFSSLNDSSQSANEQQHFRESASRMRTSIDAVRSAMPGKNSAELAQLETGQATMLQYFQTMVQVCAEQKCNEALDLHTQKVIPLNRDLERIANDLSSAQKEMSLGIAQEAEHQRAFSNWLGFILVGAILGISVISAFVLRTVNIGLRQCAAGMGTGAQQIASAAGQVAAASESLAQQASSQAASLEETSATTGEISSMTKRNAENTRSATELVHLGEKSMAEANRRLEKMVHSMREINASSDKISRIIRVIEEIAFQTNILALNAAVEAARAGAAGMGFAVVADEVRNLAQRCSKAAHDTTSLIEESISRATGGTADLDLVAKAINEVAENFAQIKTLVEEVNLSSQEQAKGIEQVTQTMTVMNRTTQQTAASAEQSAAAATQMSAQTQSMSDLIVSLRSMVEDRAA